MRDWSTTGDDGAVRVQRLNGEILGSGFLVDERRVLTCAHVVAGIEEVVLVFLADPTKALRARVGRRTHDWEQGKDLAVLELGEEAPANARPLRLTAPQANDRFRAIGFPEGGDLGLWARGLTVGGNLRGWVQIEPEGARGVEPGFSGGAAWIDEAKAAVGMIVARSDDEIAWLVPTGSLRRELPDLPAGDQAPGPAARQPFRAEIDPPDLYVPRREYDQVLAALTSSVDGTRTVALTTALRGAGGYGKTTLAQALCHDPAICRAFPEGVLWTTMGEGLRASDRLARLRDLLRRWSGEEPPAFETATAAGAALREALAGRRVLLVVDDVWDPADVAPFYGLGPEAVILITTRDRRNLPRGTVPFDIDEMRSDEAIDLLAADIPGATENAAHRDRLRWLAARLGEWPLLLSLVNRQIGAHLGDGLDLPAALSEVEEALDSHGVRAFDRENSTARRDAVHRTLAVSLGRLDDEDRRRFLDLAVFPEDADVPLSVAVALWGVSPVDAKRLAGRLRDLSLLRSLDRAAGTLRLHDVVRAYLLDVSLQPLVVLHRRLLDTFRPPSGAWRDLPSDPAYPWRHLANHLLAAGGTEELRDLLFDLDWLDAKLRRLGVNALLADCERLRDDFEVAQLHGALRLSAHVLVLAPDQLTSQLVSRLTPSGRCVPMLLDQCRRRGGLLHLRPDSIGPGGPLVRILVGHRGPVNEVAVVDAHRVISASFDGTLRLWDIESGESLRTFEGHLASVNAVTVVSDRRVVSASDDCTLRLWDLESGECLYILRVHSSSVLAVAALDEHTVISALLDGTLRQWDLDNGECLRTLQGHTDWVRAVALVGDSRVVSASHDGTLRLWDLEAAESIRTFEGHTRPVLAVTVLDDHHVVSASEDRTLRVWDLDSGESLQTLEGHSGRVVAVAKLDEQRAVSVSEDGTLRVWNLAYGGSHRTIEGHTRSFLSVAVNDKHRVVSSSEDGTLRVWDLDAAARLDTLGRHSDSIRAVAVLDEHSAVSASYDGTLCLWDRDSGESLVTFKGHTEGVLAVCGLPQRRIVSASLDCTLRVWDLDSGECRLNLSGHSGPVRGVAVLGEHRIVSASDDGTLAIWDLGLRKCVRILTGHSAGLVAVAVLDDHRVVSTSYDGTMRLWDTESGEMLRTLEGHTSWVHGVAVVDQRRVVSASIDQTLRVWDISSGEILRNLDGHSGSVLGVAVLDERRVVSASLDGTLRLWDVNSGDQAVALTLDNPPTSLAVHRPTCTVVAGDLSGRLHFLRYFDPSSTRP